MKRLVLWSHGADAQPWGAKSRTLAETAAAKGFSFEALDYTDTADPDERAARLRAVVAEKQPAVLAGSSMGGYASIVASMSSDVRGLFVVAPAVYLPGYGQHMFSDLPKHIEVVHGWRDEVVPVENAIRFARLHGATLHALEADHRLSGRAEDVAAIFGVALENLG